MLINPAVYYGCVDRSKLVWSLLSPLAPHPNASIRYIVINLTVNTLLHCLLWAAMLGTSPVVFALAWKQLINVWPALIVLAALSALSVLPYWYLALKPADEARHGGTNGAIDGRAPANKSVYVVSTSL